MHALQRLARWEQGGAGESVDDLRAELKKAMEDYCGVFRTEEVLRRAWRRSPTSSGA